MDGIHDMGGMHGFGEVPHEADEPVFHDDWERRVWGLMFAMTAPPDASLDGSRANIERMPPHLYLGCSYFERWLHHIVTYQLAGGGISMEEIKTGKPAAGSEPRTDAMGPEAVDPYFVPMFRRDIDAAPAYAIGDSVRTVNIHPVSHTRLPRYARDKVGTVVLHHGAHVFPDSNALGEGESPTHLYTVQFASTELWGDDGHPNDAISLDIWECHLERA